MKELIFVPIFFIPLLTVTHAANLEPSPARECAICHFRWMEPFYYEERGTELHPLQTEKVAGTEMMCFSCHDGSTEDSRVKVWLRDRHKVNVRPSKRVHIPKIFPLSPDGKIVCSTCHSAHGVPTDTSIERVIFLRISNKDSIMCELCHYQQTKEGWNHPIHTGKRDIPQILKKAGAVVSSSNPKNIICESCHTAHGGIEKNFILPISNSSLCSSCHPEKVIDSAPKLASRRNHPLGVKLSGTAPDRHFYCGKGQTIQCSSCHSVHQAGSSPKRPYKLLTAPIRRSQLCILCHREKRESTKNHPIQIAIRSTSKGKVKFFSGPGNTLQCMTCHGVHQKKKLPEILVETRDQLCRDCHEDAYLLLGTDHDMRVTAPGGKNVLGEDIKSGGVCSACHVPHGARGPYLWARPLRSGAASAGIASALCKSCHEKDGLAQKKPIGVFTHPTNVDFRDKAPRGLPLYKSHGRLRLVQCTTCHNPHRWQPGVMKQGNGKNVEGTPETSFLRMPANKTPGLCGVCHSEQLLVKDTEHDMRVTAPGEKNIVGEDVKSGGVCSACHVPHNARGPYLWARPLRSDSRDVGTSTRLCESCHSEGGPAHKKLTGSNTHPTNVVFKGDVPKGLPLFASNGRSHLVQCVTCHDPHRWYPLLKKKGPGENKEGTEATSFLRLPNLNRPLLCGSCHREKAYVCGTDHDLRLSAPNYKNLLGKPVDRISPCAACHAVHNAQTKVFLWVAPLGQGQDFVEQTCYGCHQKGGVAGRKTVSAGSHPLELYFGYQKKYLPLVMVKQVPLFTKDGRRSQKGEITCATCHDPHIWDDANPGIVPGKNVEGTIANSFLSGRNLLMENFCSICHGPSALFLFRYYHDASMRRDLHEHKIPLIQMFR